MKTYLRLFSLIIPLCVNSLLGQEGSDRVHLFQGFVADGLITEETYWDAGVEFSDFSGANIFDLGGRAGFSVAPGLEFLGGISFLNVNPERGDSNSGLSDLLFAGKYQLQNDETRVAVGGFLTLPIGNESVGQGRANFGGFGSLRHPVADNLTATGILGLNLFDTGNDYDVSLSLNGGLIYLLNSDLSFVGELALETKGDFTLLSGGLDYDAQNGGRIRGLLGIGVDSGAPDVQVRVGYLRNL